MTGFRKATKLQARARVAFTGPSGSGKTFTALTWAQALGGTIGVIDSERGSASLYADSFEFDTLDMTPPYHPDRLIEALDEAAEYDVTVIDSLSHYWSGEGGALEIVDQLKGRSSSDGFRAWGTVTPIQQRMVDAILRHPGHVIVTMRSKTQYALTRGDDGKNKVEKLGLAPVQRDDIEYEWTAVLDLDMSNTAHVSKSRCPGLYDRDIPPVDTIEAARLFADWITDGAPPPPPAARAAVEALGARVAELPPVTQGALRARWNTSGLPPLKSIRTAEELGFVASLVDAVEKEMGAQLPAQRDGEQTELLGTPA